MCASQKSEKFINLVLEYCAGGDLSKYIHKHGPFPERVCRHFMRQLGPCCAVLRRALFHRALAQVLFVLMRLPASGVEFLWSNHLIHRDLKPQNLLLSHEGPDAQLKIGVVLCLPPPPSPFVRCRLLLCIVVLLAPLLVVLLPWSYVLLQRSLFSCV